MKPTDIIFDFNHLAKADNALAVNASPYMKYIDGKSDGTVAGTRVEVVLPNNKFEKISVKLPGQNHAITPDSFKEDGVTYKVKFSPDFEGKFYRTATGDYALSCKASAVEVIK